MVKLLCFLKRNPSLSVEQFHDHWLNVHGALFAKNKELHRYIARYEQNHRLTDDYLRDQNRPFDQQGFDGVTVIWYHSLEDFHAMAKDPVYQRVVVPDEKTLLDPNTQAWIIAGAEDTIVDKPDARTDAQAKLLCLLRRNAALDRSTFHKHWLEHHGGLFQKEPNLNKDIMAYDQNHRLDDDYTIGEDRRFDGVTEQWFESLARFYESLKEPEQKTLVEPDVAYMLDPAGTHFIMSDLPQVIIGD